MWLKCLMRSEDGSVLVFVSECCSLLSGHLRKPASINIFKAPALTIHTVSAAYVRTAGYWLAREIEQHVNFLRKQPKGKAFLEVELCAASLTSPRITQLGWLPARAGVRGRIPIQTGRMRPPVATHGQCRSPVICECYFLCVG
jgi:hypothetical protein